jgi:hypothetical protein
VTSATASTVDVEREQRGLVIDARGRGAGREVSWRGGYFSFFAFFSRMVSLSFHSRRTACVSSS